jgi:Ankyrin repeat
LAIWLLGEHSDVIDVNHLDATNGTALHSAASKGHRGIKMLHLLIDKYGADINIRNDSKLSAYDILSMERTTSLFASSVFQLPDWLKPTEPLATSESASAAQEEPATTKHKTSTKRKSRKQEVSDEDEEDADDAMDDDSEAEEYASKKKRGSKRRKI